MPLICFLVIIAAGYGLVVDDAYRLVSELTRETWRAQDAVAWMLRRHHPAGPVIAAAMLVMLLILSVTMLMVVPLAFAAGGPALARGGDFGPLHVGLRAAKLQASGQSP